MYYGQYGCCDPCQFGYAYPVAGAYGCQNWFALIVVLFILLIIIGASCYCK
jgi:uncharacterized protein (TIGR01732 family)